MPLGLFDQVAASERSTRKLAKALGSWEDIRVARHFFVHTVEEITNMTYRH